VEQHEFDAGAGQLIVVYLPPDTGVEIDTIGLFEAVAADAASRSSGGFELHSLTSQDLRHSALFMGRQGSGFESKAAVVAVYRSTPKPATSLPG
jgi:hypothetical protein